MALPKSLASADIADGWLEDQLAAPQFVALVRVLDDVRKLDCA